ncbi:MAG: hypothetical protein ACOC83_10170 [Gemmatimonadota bacterium]
MTHAARPALAPVAPILAALVLAGGGPRAAPAQDVHPPDSVPTPYEAVEGVWAELPDGREWGATSAVYPAPDGRGIWAAERCGANLCVDSDVDPVLLFDLEGEVVRSFGAGMFAWPHGMHVDPDGNVWVTDAVGYAPVPEGWGHVVYKFSPEGELLMTLGQKGVAGDGPDTFNKPSDVLVAPDGNVFVADGHDAGGNNRIVKLSPEGEFLEAWGTTGEAPGEFRDPHALAMDSRGRLFVADRGNNRIQIFDQEGNHLESWTEFGRPSGLYIDGDDVLYAADSESNTARNPGVRRGIYIGSAEDGTLHAFIPDPEPNPDESGTSGAEGVAVDAEGAVYGAEVGPTMLRKYVAGSRTASAGHTSAREDDNGSASSQDAAPTFRVDPFWPQPLPENWILGQVAGVAVDDRDHVWIVHRQSSLTPQETGATREPPWGECCVPAPPVIEFDPEGEVVRSWGGPGEGYDWPESEHGIFVDGDRNVWIGGNGPSDHQVLKFTSDGDFLLQIGEAGENAGSNDTTTLGRPADVFVDDEADEVYVADGYGNRRVVVFDAGTGEYRRHWGAYGERPEDVDLGSYDPDAEPAPQFRTPVHALQITDDGLVYVADRPNDRIQVFRRDGTFVEEAFLAPRTLSMGTVWDLDVSRDPEQRWLYVPDGTNNKLWILDRESLEVVGSFGRGGRYAGDFMWVHNVAVDSRGDLYTGEVETGKRVQKFVRTDEDGSR